MECKWIGCSGLGNSNDLGLGGGAVDFDGGSGYLCFAWPDAPEWNMSDEGWSDVGESGLLVS